MELRTCCIIGNRLMPRGQAGMIAARIEEEIVKMHAQGVTRFMTGGGLGFETLAAQVVLQAREKHPGIRLVLALPSRDQAAKWPASSVAIYEGIKGQANEIVYTAETSGRGHLLKRNRYMVDQSEIVLAYLAKTTGRTVQTVKYAEKVGKEIVRISRDDPPAGG